MTDKSLRGVPTREVQIVPKCENFDSHLTQVTSAHRSVSRLPAGTLEYS